MRRLHRLEIAFRTSALPPAALAPLIAEFPGPEFKSLGRYSRNYKRHNR